MPLKLKRGAKARSDQSAIWLYIATNNLTAADQQMDRLHQCFLMLANHPEIGRRRIDFAANLRSFPVDQYVVFYRLSPGTVEIVRLLHAARDITPDLLSD